jgi:hypothetical protein
MPTGAHKTQSIASALISQRDNQRWRWISQSHCASIWWWFLCFICKCWNKRAVKAMDAHTFTYKLQKADGNLFLGQERSADCDIHATMGHSNVGSVLRNTKITSQGQWHPVLCSCVTLHIRSHSSAAAAFQMGVFDQTAYSPDIAPSDNLLLETWRIICCHRTSTLLKEGVRSCLGSNAADFFDTGVQKLILLYGKCLNSACDDSEN